MDFSKLFRSRRLALPEQCALSLKPVSGRRRDTRFGNSKPQVPSGGARELTPGKITAGTPGLWTGEDTQDNNKG